MAEINICEDDVKIECAFDSRNNSNLTIQKQSQLFKK
jgi:hypothetical protein